MTDESPSLTGRKVVALFAVVVVASMAVMLLSVYAGDGPIWERVESEPEPPAPAVDSQELAEPVEAVAPSPEPVAEPAWPIHVGIRCEDEQARSFRVYADGTEVGTLQITCEMPLPTMPQAQVIVERGGAFVLRVQDDTGDHHAEYEVFPSAETWVTVTHRVLDGRSYATSFETSFEAW